MKTILHLGVDTIIDGRLDELFNCDLTNIAVLGITTTYELKSLLSGVGSGKNSIHGDVKLYNLNYF